MNVCKAILPVRFFFGLSTSVFKKSIRDQLIIVNATMIMKCIYIYVCLIVFMKIDWNDYLILLNLDIWDRIQLKKPAPNFLRIETISLSLHVSIDDTSPWYHTYYIALVFLPLEGTQGSKYENSTTWFRYVKS